MMKIVQIQFFVLLSIFSCNLFAQNQNNEIVRFTILHTNDEHSHLIPHPAINDHPEKENSAIGGFARLAGAINEIRNKKTENSEPVLIFSGGDILGGPAFGWLPLMGMAAELKIMQEIGYDAVTIGNHEFDYGPDIFASYLEAAGYPAASSKTVILGTNTRPPGDHPLSEMGIKNHYIKELENGLKVGIFGLLGKDAINKTAHPGPVDFEDPVQSALKAVEELKQAGAEIIISVNHSGVYEDRILAQEVPDIDVIVGGHSHTALFEPVIEGNTIIVQAGSYLRYLGILELEWNRNNGEISIRNEMEGTPFLQLLDTDAPEDENISEMVHEYRSILNDWIAVLTENKINDLNQPVAESSFVISGGRQQKETAIGNYITDAMRHSAEQVLGKKVDIAVQANGAIRAEIVPGIEEWSEKQISFYDLIMTSGLGSGDDGNPGYPLVSFYLTEREIRNALEVSVLLSEMMDNTYFLQFSGLRKTYDPDRAILMRIPFTGTPIPTSRAVLSAEVALEGEYFPIRKDSEVLLHVVTDHYIAGFLPLVGEVVPNLAIELKDEYGNPAELDDTIIMNNGEQFKVWQAVLNYTLSHEIGENGLPEIPGYYETTQDRLVIAYTWPLWIWPAFILFLSVLVLLFFIRRMRMKKRTIQEGNAI